MTWQIAYVLGLLVTAVVMFATEKLSVDIVTLLCLVALVAAGIITPREAFAGFSDEIIIILGAIFVICGALQATGTLDLLGHRILKLGQGSFTRLLSAVMGSSCFISAFMNNTTVTAMLQPPVFTLARKLRISPSQVLMPLAFASIMGGTCTLIGTSTNVAVSGYLKRHGIAEVGMFEITPMGIAIVVAGMLYLLFIGRHLLPKHGAGEIEASYGMREYLSEIVVMPGSPLIGQSTFDSDLNILDFRVLKLIRGELEYLPGTRLHIEEGDLLIVSGKVETLVKVKKIEGIEIKPALDLGDLAADTDLQVAELLVTPQSELAGRTVKEADFRRIHGLTVLALYRTGTSLRDKLGDIILRVGDVLLAQGPRERIAAARANPGFSVLDEVPEPSFDPRKGWWTIGIFLASIAAGTLGWLPVSIAFLLAAIAVVLLRCITIEKAYEFIDWKLLVLIGGMTAFGTAMSNTGAAAWLAGHIVTWLLPFGVMAVIAGFFVLTIILTQPMSNAAAALVVLPVALEAADKIGANPHTFGISIMLAASISFIAPFEPSCILVYGPGKYRFGDFVKVGSGLTLVLLVVVLALLPVFWPVMK
jgi:di/tricarboxylate transporter